MSNEEVIKNKIYTLKFICSIFIIFSHAYNIQAYNINMKNSSLSKFIYMFENYESLFTKLAVAIFFFISGFLFFHNIETSSVKEKLKKRTKTVLLKYIIWSSIYYLYYCFISKLSFANKVTSHGLYTFNFDSWVNFLLINKQLTALWFMETLILILLFTPLINKILKNKKTIIIAIFILVIFNFTPYKKHFIGIIDTNYLLYFIFGSYFGYNKIHHFSKKVNCISLVSILLFPILLPFINSKWFFVIILLEILCAWSSVDLLNIDVKWWMKETTFTYVFHEIPLEIIEKLILFGLGIKPIFALIDFIIAPSLSFIISIYIAKILKKYFYSLYNVLA